MNTKLWMVLAATLITGLAVSPLRAQDSSTNTPPSPQISGIITGENVNVRGKPTLTNEDVTQLNPGDRVTILQEIPLKQPKAGEPDKWLRIALPKNVPVWVHSGYIDPATKAVKATRLNLRSGPGENYSVLGWIPTGAVVADLETRGDWMRIEPPQGTFAFVAAFLVTPVPGTPPAEVATTEPPTEPVVTEPVTVPVTEPVVTEPVSVATVPTNVPPPITNETEVVVAPEPVVPTSPPPIVDVTMEPPVTEPAVTEPAVTEPAETAPAMVEAPGETTPETTPEVVEETELTLPIEALEEEIEEPEPPPKRIVYREGIVRRSASIQAPTYFVLQDILRKRTINYLHNPGTNNIVLQDYYGTRVLVVGEEVLDERWPNTPVIKIQTLRSVY